MPAFPNALYAYVGAFVDELVRAGAHHVVICPGSRSTPLALACASQPGLRVWMHVDERSAAFFALGLAKRLGEPVALVCTSGTAAANFYPAIIEARLTHVPLLVLTADRPPELREVGAPQAIDQNRLYGQHVKWFADVALPEATNDALRYIRTLADRAVALTQAIPAGPVHLNCPFREPLTPEAGPLPPSEARDPAAWEGRPKGEPYTRVTNSSLALPMTLSRLFNQCYDEPHGLIIAGPMQLAEARALDLVLLTTAKRLGYPVLADPLSQLRCVGDLQTNIYSTDIITSYDAFLRSERFAKEMEPKIILRFGAMPVSKPLLLYLQRYPNCKQIVIDGAGDWNEPTHLAAEIVHADPVEFCGRFNSLADFRTSESVNAQIRAIGSEPFEQIEAQPERIAWQARWREVDTATRQALSTAMQEYDEPFEGRVFTELAENLPTETTLFVGNSMPVRDLDTFFWGGGEAPIHIIGNRGANGIDGVVSSALGASAAAKVLHERDEQAEHAKRARKHRDKPAPAVLVIGDLSFYHDMNGLLAARLHQLDLTIVLINNDGGGIFSFLPQASYPDRFETLFGTPTGLDFAQAARLYGANYTHVQTWEDFRNALSDGITGGSLSIIEVKTNRASNVALHRRLWQAMEHAVDKALA